MLEKLNKIRKFLLVRLLTFLAGFSFFTIWFVDYVQETNQLPTWNIVFVLDLSNSMNVQDVFYNSHQVSRLQLAKKIIENTVKNLDYKFWLVIFADRFNYFIPPTYDKDIFLKFLEPLNTNYLNWGETNIENLVLWLNNNLNALDQIVFLSDFDFNVPQNLKIKNYGYFVWIWQTKPSIVKNANWKTLFKDWKPLTSSLNTKTLNILWNKNWEIIIITDFKSSDKLNILKQIKNIETDSSGLDWKLLVWIILILLSL